MLMRPTRAAIITPVCDLIFASSTFATTGRRVLAWAKVDDQPACFIRHTGDSYSYNGTILATLTMKLEIWIYARSPNDTDVSPGEILDGLVDAIDGLLLPDDDNMGTCTLGGLVQHAWIDGEAVYDPGDFDNQAKAVMDLHILVP